MRRKDEGEERTEEKETMKSWKIQSEEKQKGRKIKDNTSKTWKDKYILVRVKMIEGVEEGENKIEID